MAYGWMVGLSKGMDDYASILGEKRKEQNLIAREELAYKRQVGLENLRNTNATKGREQTHRWQVERDKALRENQVADTSSNRQFILDQKAADRKYAADTKLADRKWDEEIYQKRRGDKLEDAKETFKFQLEQQEQIYNLTKELNHDQKVEELESMKKTEYWKSATPSEKQDIEFMFLHPTVGKIFMEARTKGLASKEMQVQYSKVWDNKAKEYHELPDDTVVFGVGTGRSLTKAQFKKQAAANGENPSNLYATIAATEATGIDRITSKLIKGGGNRDTYDREQHYDSAVTLIEKAKGGDRTAQAQIPGLLEKARSAGNAEYLELKKLIPNTWDSVTTPKEEVAEPTISTQTDPGPRVQEPPKKWGTGLSIGPGWMDRLHGHNQ